MAGPLADAKIENRLGRPDDDPTRLRIVPFEPRQVKRREDGTRLMGYGLSCFGYDVRLAHTFRWVRQPGRPLPAGRPGGSVVLPDDYLVLDPLDPDVGARCFDPPVGDPPRVMDRPFVLLPGECVLGESVERIRVPEDCVALVICKSTWARCFLDLNTTPLEPGWEGTVTLEIVNHAPLPLRIRPGEGIGQVVFFASGDGCCREPYHRKSTSSYQGQAGPTPPRHSGGSP